MISLYGLGASAITRATDRFRRPFIDPLVELEPNTPDQPAQAAGVPVIQATVSPYGGGRGWSPGDEAAPPVGPKGETFTMRPHGGFDPMVKDLLIAAGILAGLAWIFKRKTAPATSINGSRRR